MKIDWKSTQLRVVLWISFIATPLLIMPLMSQFYGMRNMPPGPYAIDGDTPRFMRLVLEPGYQIDYFLRCKIPGPCIPDAMVFADMQCVYIASFILWGTFFSGFSYEVFRWWKLTKQKQS